MNILEKKGHKFKERQLKRRVLRAFEMLQAELDEKFELAENFRKRVILQHMRNYAFVKMRERSIAQLFESSRWSKLTAFVFREWRSLQINLEKARNFRRETLINGAIISL